MSSLKCFFNLAYTQAVPPANLSGDKYEKYLAQRKFYNLTADYNMFSYILDGKKVMKNATAEDYFTRGGTNEGLFNLQGPMNEQQISALKEKLKNTKSVIWHGVISFDEETSLGFNSQEKAVKFLRQTMGSLFERTQLRQDNLEFYASVHTDTDNRHIHFAFFEKEPLRRDKNGVLGYTKRGSLPQKALDNYLISANMHLSEHAEDYYTARDRAMSRLNELRKTRGGMRFSTSSGNMLDYEFGKLIKSLPSTGRLQYNAKNIESLRPQIDRVAELLIQSDPAAALAHKQVLEQFARVRREVTDIAAAGRIGYVNNKRMTAEELAAIMGHKPQFNEKIDLKYVDLNNIDYFEKLQEDYKARVGNVVLGMCKEASHRGTDNWRPMVASVNDLNRKIAAKAKRRSRRNAYSNALQLLTRVSNSERSNIDSVCFNEAVIEAENRQEYYAKGRG